MLGLQIFEFIASFIEIISGIIVCKNALSDKTNKNSQMIMGALLAATVIWILNQKHIFSIAVTIVAIFCIVINTYLIYKIILQDVLILAIFYYVLVYIVDFGVLSVAGMMLQEEQMAQIIAGGFSWVRISVMMLSKMVLVCVSWALVKYVLQKVSFPVRKMWIGIGLSSILLYYLIQITFDAVDADITLSWLFLLAFFVLAAYSLVQYLKFVEDRRNWMVALEHNRVQIEAYGNLIESYQESYSFYHDLKNQYLVLKGYLGRCEFDKAQEFMQELELPYYGNLYKTRTGIQSADILINHKIKEANAQGIKVTISSDLLNLLMTPQELTALLGNAIDNAIEACQKIHHGKKWIDISIQKKQKMTFIKISNSYEEQPVEKWGKLISTKENPKLHSLGMQSMRMIVEKYDGLMKVEYSEGVFSIFISFFY